MVYTSPKGRDWSSVVNWDSLAKFYASFAIAWTVILLIGMGWLILHRHLSFLRIRNIPLAIAATSTLHVYLVKILLAYTVNGNFPCTAEFWIMSIYLPFGIALFQANMVQLQSVNGQQQKFLLGQPSLHQAKASRRQRGIRGLWMRWCAMTDVKRAEILIATGMVTQLIVTLALYLASRKFHGSWGSISQQVGPADCRKGGEWIPSTIWQLVWAWFYGPYILYMIRNINDVHYRRIQTTLCVISGLPGTPLWLASVYSNSFNNVNRYWVPPMWLAPGIVMMQAVTIFFPIFEAYRSRSQLRNALDIVKAWEQRNQGDGSTTYSGSTKNNSFGGRKSGSTDTLSSRRREMYTMPALEKALVSNPTPLLHFAAAKEFTGENIIFLMQVRDWRAAWNRAHREFGTVTGQVRRNLFNMAVEIITLSVHTKTADFPVNIEGKIRSQLEEIFGPAVADVRQHLNDDDDVVDPFNQPPSAKSGLEFFVTSYAKTDRQVSASGRSDSDKTLSESREAIRPSTEKIYLDVQPFVSEAVREPLGFDEHVFDEAERSVKYLVFTNTWPKFVDSSKDHDN